MAGEFPLVHNEPLSVTSKFMLRSDGAGPLGNLRMS